MCVCINESREKLSFSFCLFSCYIGFFFVSAIIFVSFSTMRVCFIDPFTFTRWWSSLSFDNTTGERERNCTRKREREKKDSSSGIAGFFRCYFFLGGIVRIGFLEKMRRQEKRRRKWVFWGETCNTEWS